jgi:hypothetical protein
MCHVAEERRSRHTKCAVVTAPLAAARVRLLPLPPQVASLADVLRWSVEATAGGLAQSAALRRGTHARGAARHERVQHELEWLSAAEERLAQQRASQARLYVDSSLHEPTQRESAAQARVSEMACAQARAALVPLVEQLQKEQTARTAAAAREVQLTRHAEALHAELLRCAALYPGLGVLLARSAAWPAAGPAAHGGSEGGPSTHDDNDDASEAEEAFYSARSETRSDPRSESEHAALVAELQQEMFCDDVNPPPASVAWSEVVSPRGLEPIAFPMRC